MNPRYSNNPVTGPAQGTESVGELDEFPDVQSFELDQPTQRLMRNRGFNPDQYAKKVNDNIQKGGKLKRESLVEAAAWTDLANNNAATTNWLSGQRVLTAKDVSQPQSVGAFQSLTGSIGNGFAEIVSGLGKLTVAQYEMQKGVVNKVAGAVTGQPRPGGAIDTAEWLDANKAIDNFISPYTTYISDNFKQPIVSYDEKNGIGWNINADSLVGLISQGAEFMMPSLLTAGVGTVASLGTRAALKGATTALAQTQGLAKLAGIGSKVAKVTGATAFLQTFPSYQKEAYDSGMDIMESTLFALPVAGITAAIETMNVGPLAKALGLSDQAAKSVIREATRKEVAAGLKELADNPLWQGMMVETASKEARAQLLAETAKGVAKKTLLALSNQSEMGILSRLVTGSAKRVGRGFVEQGVPEAGEEILQSLVENASKDIYNNLFARTDAVEGDGRFKDPKFSDYVYQSLYGSLNGFLLGGMVGSLAQTKKLDPTLFGYVAAGTRTQMHEGTPFEQIIGDVQNPGSHPIFEVLENERLNGTFTDEQAAGLRAKVRQMATTARDFDRFNAFTDSDRHVMYDLSANGQELEKEAATIADTRAKLSQIDADLGSANLTPAERLQAQMVRTELVDSVGGDIDQAEARFTQKQQAFQNLDAVTRDSYTRQDVERTALQDFYKNNLSAYQEQAGIASDEDRFVPFAQVTDPATGTRFAFDASQKVFRQVELAGGQVIAPATLDTEGRYVRAQRSPGLYLTQKTLSSLPEYLSIAQGVTTRGSAINQSVSPFTDPDNSPQANWLADGQDLITQLQTLKGKKKALAATQQLAGAYLRDSQFLADEAGYSAAYAPIQSELQNLLGIQPEVAMPVQPQSANQSTNTDPNDVSDTSWQTYIDKGALTADAESSVLDSIVNQIVSGQPLTGRQTAVREGYTDEIESRLQAVLSDASSQPPTPDVNSQPIQPQLINESATPQSISPVAPASSTEQSDYAVELERKSTLDAARTAQQEFEAALRAADQIGELSESDLGTLQQLAQAVESANRAVEAVIGPELSEFVEQPVNPVPASSGRNTPTLRESWPNLSPDVRREAAGLAQAYLDGYDGGNLSSAERQIYATLGKIKNLKEGWARFGDVNSFTQSIARAYATPVSQTSALRLDQYVAVQQEDMPSLTEQDVLDFMMKFPTGVDKAKTYGLEPLRQRFVELTGKSLDFSSAKNVVSFASESPAGELTVDVTADDLSFAEQLLAEFSPEGVAALNDWLNAYKAEYGEEWLVQLDKEKSDLYPPLPETLERLIEQSVDQLIFNNNPNLYYESAEFILALTGRSETRSGDGTRGVVEEPTPADGGSGGQSAETGEPTIATLKDQTAALERQVSDPTEARDFDELERFADERIAFTESEISAEVSSNPVTAPIVAPLDEAIATASNQEAADLQQQKIQLARQLVESEQSSIFPLAWQPAEQSARRWSESKAIEARLADQIDTIASNPAGLDAQIVRYQQRAQNAVLAGQQVVARDWQEVPDELYDQVNGLFDVLSLPKTGSRMSDFSDLLGRLPAEVGAYASSGQGINPAGIIEAPGFWPFWNQTALPIIQGRLANEQSGALKEAERRQRKTSEKALEDYYTQVDAVGKAGLLNLGDQNLITEIERAGLPVPLSITILANRYSQQPKANGLPSPVDLESDRPRTTAPNGVGANAIQPAGRTEPGPVVGERGPDAGAGWLPEQGDSGVSARSADAAGEPGDSDIPAGTSIGGLSDDPAGRADDPGSRRFDAERIQHAGAAALAGSGPITGKGGRFADLVRQTQQALVQLPALTADQTNINQMLPVLLDNQRENVRKAEQRLLVENQKGILYTDGTGTGKTLSGLGVIARFRKLLGTDDILIVVPSDKKAKDWIEEGEFLSLPISQLSGTKDAGRGISVTSYANFGQNEALTSRNWRLIVYDESHNLNSNADGKSTLAQNRHRDLTSPALDAYYKARDEFKEEYRVADQMDSFDQPGDVRQQGRELRKAIDEKRKARTRELIDQTKVVFLSATPFAYHKNLAYADGFLFTAYQELDADLKPVERSYSYNAGDAFDKLLMGSFGYSMRYNKLTRPEAGVDVGLLEREFVENLKKTGAVSSTRLNIPQDYSRQFVVLSDQGDVIGRTIDEGFRILSEDERFRDLADAVRKNFNYLRRAQLLENLKAKLAIPRIQQHLELGRKAVVFHSYNKSEITHPFRFDYLLEPTAGGDPATKASAISQAKVFTREFPQFSRLDLTGLTNPIDALTNALGDQVAIFNGNKTPKERSAAVRAFNDDTSNVRVIVVNLAAGEAGLNLHDTTGQFPRVEMQIGLPVRPTSAIQAEGRIYRQGQKSDAVFEYLVTGTSFEQTTFGTNISSRASTAENMGIGSGARDLEAAFRDGYADATSDAPSLVQGQGGKQSDQVETTITPFDKAITYYYKRQKKNQKTKSFEGVDYFGTPEPLGYKMAEWAGIKRGTDVAEPSAGHGAIARFVPAGVNLTTIEPSSILSAELAVVVGGNIISGTFENHHAVNKYDTILMNPPFGTAGKTAFEHLRKAFSHLRDKGRLIALVPAGQFDDRYTKWLSETNARTGKTNMEVEPLHLAARILLPTSTFERAGTNVATQILIIDKEYTAALRDNLRPTRTVDLRGQAATADELFDLIRDLDMPTRIELPGDSVTESAVGDVSGVLQPTDPSVTIASKQPEATAPALPARQPSVLAPVKNRHAKKGTDIFVVQMAARLSDEQYQRIKTISGRYSGYYSSFRGNGAIPGFIFNSEDQANGFYREVEGQPVQTEVPVEGPQFQLPDDFGSQRVAIVSTPERFSNIRQAKEFARVNLVGKTFHNKNTGEEILVSRNAIDKTFSESAMGKSTMTQAHIDAVSALPQLLEESVLAEEYADRADNYHVQQIQRFYGAIQIGNEIYRAKTTVKSIRQEGYKFYTYEVQEMELLPARQQTWKGVSDEGINPTTDSNSIAVANLLDGAVKSNGEPFFSLAPTQQIQQTAALENPPLATFVETLQLFDPTIPVSSDLASYQQALVDSGALEKTGGIRPKGFQWKGRVHLDPMQADGNTALHEFGHVWVNSTERLFNDLYIQGERLVKDSIYFTQLRREPYYKTLPYTEQVKEALARAIEDKGARFFTDGRKQSFLSWLQELGKKLMQWAGLISKSPLDMTLDEWVGEVIQKARGQNVADEVAAAFNEMGSQTPEFQLPNTPVTTAEDLRTDAESQLSNTPATVQGVPSGLTPDLLTTPSGKWTPADRRYIDQIAQETGWRLNSSAKLVWENTGNFFHVPGGGVIKQEGYQLGQVVDAGFGGAYNADAKGLFNRATLFRSMVGLMKNWTNLDTFIGWLDDASGTLTALIKGVKDDALRSSAYAAITLQPLRTQAEQLLANFSEQLAGKGLARMVTGQTFDVDEAGNVIQRDINLPISLAMGVVLTADTQQASYGLTSHVLATPPAADQLVRRNPDGSLSRIPKGLRYEDADGNSQYLLFDQAQIDALRNRFETGAGGYSGEAQAYAALKTFFIQPEIQRLLAAENRFLNPGTEFQSLDAYYPVRSVKPGSSPQIRRTLADSRILVGREGASEVAVLIDPVQAMGEYSNAVDDVLQYGRLVQNLEHLQQAIDAHYTGPRKREIVGYLKARIDDYSNHRQKRAEAYENNPMNRAAEGLMRKYIQSVFSVNLKLPLLQAGTFVNAYGLGIIDSPFLNQAWKNLAALTFGAYTELTAPGVLNTGGDEYRTKLLKMETMEAEYMKWLMGDHLPDDLAKQRHREKFALIIYRLTSGQTLATGDVAFDDLKRRNTALTAVQQTVKKIDTWSDSYGKGMMLRADRGVILSFLEAARLQATAEGLDPRIDAYDSRVADLTERVMMSTNQMTNLSEQTQQQLSTDFFAKIVGLFSGQQQKLLNTVLQSMTTWIKTGEGTPEAAAAFKKLAAAFSTGVVFNALYVAILGGLFSALMAALSGDDPKPDEEIVEQIGWDFARGVASMVPGMGQIAADYFISQHDLIRGNEEMVDVLAIQSIAEGVDMVNAIGNIWLAESEEKREKAQDSALYYFTTFAAHTTGLPASLTRIGRERLTLDADDLENDEE
jgi:hypothetical protein